MSIHYIIKQNPVNGLKFISVLPPHTMSDLVRAQAKIKKKYINHPFKPWLIDMEKVWEKQQNEIQRQSVVAPTTTPL